MGSRHRGFLLVRVPCVDEESGKKGAEMTLCGGVCIQVRRRAFRRKSGGEKLKSPPTARLMTK